MIVGRPKGRLGGCLAKTLQSGPYTCYKTNLRLSKAAKEKVSAIFLYLLSIVVYLTLRKEPTTNYGLLALCKHVCCTCLSSYNVEHGVAGVINY